MDWSCGSEHFSLWSAEIRKEWHNTTNRTGVYHSVASVYIRCTADNHTYIALIKPNIFREIHSEIKMSRLKKKKKRKQNWYQKLCHRRTHSLLIAYHPLQFHHIRTSE